MGRIGIRYPIEDPNDIITTGEEILTQSTGTDFEILYDDNGNVLVYDDGV